MGYMGISDLAIIRCVFHINTAKKKISIHNFDFGFGKIIDAVASLNPPVPGANLASRILLAQFVALCIFGTSLSRPKTLTDTSTAQANKVPQIWSVPWNEPSAMACSSQFASNISKPLTMSGCPVNLNPSPEELLFSFLFFCLELSM
jgi:hypothetical protein